MSNLLYVITRNMQEFRNKQWHTNKTVRYVVSPDSLRGVRNVDFTLSEGGWERKDLCDIVETLLMCNIGGEYEIKTRMLMIGMLLYA